MNQHFDTVISAGPATSRSGWKELLQYRDLILLFVRRDFALIYKQTVLGPLWILLPPFATSVVFTLIFGNIAGISTNGVPTLLFYMTSNALWTFFSNAFVLIANTFISNATVFGKVYFPRLTVPISQLISRLINFFIQFCMVLIFFVYFWIKGFHVAPSWWLAALPLVLLQIMCLSLGCGIIISALTTKYRDLSIVVSIGAQLWMYLSPVLYPLSGVTGAMRIIMLINPLSMPIEIFRLAVLGSGDVSLWPVVWSVCFTALVLLAGIRLFSRIEKTFIDTV